MRDASGSAIATVRPQVLLIDDDVVALDLFGRFLRADGFDVSVAASGRAGLSLAAHSNIDVLVLDLCLSDISGWPYSPICVREGSGCRSSPSVFATLEQAAAAMKLGAVDVLSKLRRAVALLLGLTVICAASFTTHAFDFPQHRIVANNALRAVRLMIAGKDRTFTQAAIDQVIEANEATDTRLRLSAALFMPWRHFTNEAIPPSMQNLVTLKKEILDARGKNSRTGTRRGRSWGGPSMAFRISIPTPTGWNLEIGTSSPRSERASGPDRAWICTPVRTTRMSSGRAAVGVSRPAISLSPQDAQ